MVKRKVRLRVPALCGHLKVFPDGQGWEGRSFLHLGEPDQPLPLSYLGGPGFATVPGTQQGAYHAYGWQ